jgi:hypothetical protein
VRCGFGLGADPLHGERPLGGLDSGHAESFEQVVADPEGIGHRGEGASQPRCWKPAGVNHVEVVDLVGPAVGVKRGCRGVVAEPDGAGLMCDAGEEDGALEVGVPRDEVVRVHAEVAKSLT